MSTLKKMTGTTNFEGLPDQQKKCLLHNREECQTQKFLDQVQKEFKCMPWALNPYQVGTNYIENKIYYDLLGVSLLWPREGDLCSKPNFEEQKLFGLLFRPLC